MSSAEIEGAVVISTDNFPPENIILQILGMESLPNACSVYNVKGYLWQFETKYYTAEINLYALEEKATLNKEFLDSIRAIIFYFDSQKFSSFEDVLSWMPFLKDIDSEVQLLVCNNCGQESQARKDIMNWCVENHFELIELNPSDENEDEDDTLIKDVKGYERITQALQSHTWANLIMKDDTLPLKTKQSGVEVLGTSQENNSKEEKENVEAEGNSKSASNAPSQEKSKSSKKIEVDNEEISLEDKLLADVLGGEDPGGESFEALFSRFASMKERASGLSGEERKKYAEKVAIAFWRAMGGDEDELDGLDED